MRKLEFGSLKIPEPEQPQSNTSFDPDIVYPIRLLVMNSGMFIIGELLSVRDDMLVVLQPHEVAFFYDRENRNLKEYEFIPFLDQFTETDPDMIRAVPFFKANVMTCVEPKQHMIAAFNHYRWLKYATLKDLDFHHSSEETIH